MKTHLEMKFPDYRFESRDSRAAWRPIPVTWLGGTDEIRAACASLKGARDLVAKVNAGDGELSYRVVTP